MGYRKEDMGKTSIVLILMLMSCSDIAKWGFVFYRVIHGKFLSYEEILSNQFNL
jgi:hypothetical protein